MLERSKKSDLVIEINFRGSNHSVAVLERMKDVFTEHSARIRDIALFGIESSQLANLFDVILDSSLRLTSLVLTPSHGQKYTLPISIMGDLQRYHRRSLFLVLSTALCIVTPDSRALPRASPNHFILCSPSGHAFGRFASQDLCHRRCRTYQPAQSSTPNFASSTSLLNVLSVIIVPIETVVSLYTGPDVLFASSLSLFSPPWAFGNTRSRHIDIWSYLIFLISLSEPLVDGPRQALHDYPSFRPVVCWKRSCQLVRSRTFRRSH